MPLKEIMYDRNLPKLQLYNWGLKISNDKQRISQNEYFQGNLMEQQ